MVAIFLTRDWLAFSHIFKPILARLRAGGGPDTVPAVEADGDRAAKQAGGGMR